MMSEQRLRGKHHFLLFLLGVGVLIPSYTFVLLIRLIKWSIALVALPLQLLLGIPRSLWRIKQPLQPSFVPLQETELPDAAWAALTDTSAALAAEDFVVYGDLRCDELIQGGVLWLRLLGQPEQGICALAAHIEFKTSARLDLEFIEFSTEFHDGRVLGTNNLTIPYSLPTPSYLARVQLKDVQDPRALCALHRGLIASLAQPVNLDKVKSAARDPAGFLTDSYTREIQTHIRQGCLQLNADRHTVRLRPWAALVSVWRRAWPLANLYLRAADRRSRRLLAQHGLDVDHFTGSAAMTVSRTSLAASIPIETPFTEYETVRRLAYRVDHHAVLEAVVVELNQALTGLPTPREFRYSFQGYDDQPQRRIRRLRSFDILLDPVTGTVAITATERELERAANEAEWRELTARSPLSPLQPGPWLCDLDIVLPTAQTALATQAGAERPVLDSASLYLEDGAPRWQVVAWTDQDKPLTVALDARSGRILTDSLV